MQVGLDVADGAQSAAGWFHNPMHPAPHTAMPAWLAIAASRSRSPDSARKVKGRTENYGRTGLGACRGV